MNRYILFLFVFFVLFACKSSQKQVVVENTKKENQTKEEQAYLGIIYVETISGVQIADVFPDSPAQKSGLEAGDIIISANGYPIVGRYTLKENIFSLKPGTEVVLEVEKINGKRVLLKAVLEPMPEKYKKYYKEAN
jgi:S1-C subfamily serine protease